ncbi:Zinc-binding oxidoreductase alcohol dehydrogenase [Naganishia albida]|nr:Zinc-binding oxidoreductase alcohol dehydrogenase [Naganishia albida]
MSSQVPTTMKALVQHETEKRAEVKDHPVPKLDKNEVLVKIAYVSQNPTDWKHSAYLSPPNVIIGCDYSGVIAQLGDDLKNTEWKVGDHVAGMVHGGKFTDKGSFAEYARVQSDLLWKVPSSGPVGLREAPTYGVGFTTAAQVLYTRLGLPYPPAKADGSEWILIYGGSTSVGLFALQLAKLAGFKVVTTASPRNFDLVKQFGADEVVDYHNASEAVGQIKKITNGSITKALDTISEGESFKICLESFADAGKRKYNMLLPISEEGKKLAESKGIETETTLAYTLQGNAFEFMPGQTVPAVPSDREFYVKLNKDTPDFVQKYNIKPNPITDMDGGINGILEGFEVMKSGKVSASKLVYKIADV